jgi:hypothetical protein
MGVREVSRMDAEALGAIQPEDEVMPQEGEFHEKLELSVRGLDAERRARLADVFGEQIAWGGDVVRWIGAGRLIGELWDRAMADLSLQGEVLLGQVYERAKGRWGCNTRLR